MLPHSAHMKIQGVFAGQRLSAIIRERRRIIAKLSRVSEPGYLIRTKVSCAIDWRTALMTKPTRRNWPTLLKDYVALGAEMELDCGK
jgi:hypothetical protein